MNEVEEYIDRMLRADFEHRVYMYEAMWLHGLWWGVPCGPTLSMVLPPSLRGTGQV